MTPHRRLSERPLIMPVDHERPEDRVPPPPSRVEALAIIGMWCMAAAVVTLAVALCLEVL